MVLPKRSAKTIGSLSEQNILNQNYYKWILNLNMKPKTVAEEYLHGPVLGKHIEKRAVKS